MRHKVLHTLAGVAMVGFSVAAFGSVSVDENGIGFVGKGDVQTVFDWNNAQAQENAARLQFRYANGSTATWTCVGTNPTGKVVTTHHEYTSAVSSNIAYDPRKNKVGQVTGFNLTGFEQTTPAYTTAGTCPGPLRNWLVQPTLVGDIQWQGSGEPTLQVSVDGVIWLDLVITY